MVQVDAALLIGNGMLEIEHLCKEMQGMGLCHSCCSVVEGRYILKNCGCNCILCTFTQDKWQHEVLSVHVESREVPPKNSMMCITTGLVF